MVPAWTIAWPHFSHNSHTAFSNFWGDAHTGAEPRGQTDALEFRVFHNTELFRRRIGFGWKQSMERGKLPNQEPFSTVRGVLSLWQLWQVCVCSSECCWFPWFSPTAQDPPASFSSSEVVAKTTFAAFSQSIWINVLLHILCWFIPEVHPPSAALQRLLCPAQVVVVGHSPAHGAATVQPGHFFSKIFQSWTCQLCHTPSLAGHCEDGQDQWGGNAPLDLGVPTGAGRGQGEGRWEYLRLYMGNLENINCRQHWVAITSFQFLSSCRCFVSLKVLLDYHLGSPAMALLGLLWAKTHIYSFCIYSFFTYPGIQGMCSPKWNTFGSKQLLSR